jgi:hypothetical protein
MGGNRWILGGGGMILMQSSYASIRDDADCVVMHNPTVCRGQYQTIIIALQPPYIPLAYGDGQPTVHLLVQYMYAPEGSVSARRCCITNRRLAMIKVPAMSICCCMQRHSPHLSIVQHMGYRDLLAIHQAPLAHAGYATPGRQPHTPYLNIVMFHNPAL